MTMTSKFPSALQNRNDASPTGYTPRRGPSPADVAMMNPTQYEAHARATGSWPTEELKEEFRSQLMNPESNPENRG
jgi:hypothetical protein